MALLVNLSKTGGKICQNRGEIIIFSKQGGNVLKQGKGEKIRNLWSMTKKIRSSEISADENQEIFREKGKIGLGTFSSESENFPTIGGKSKTGGEMHHGLRGDGRP